MSAVNHPSHYNKCGIECIDVIRAFYGDESYESFCLGNALKYVMRCRDKENYVQDLKKARFYIDEIIAMHNNDDRKIISRL